MVPKCNAVQIYKNIFNVQTIINHFEQNGIVVAMYEQNERKIKTYIILLINCLQDK